MTLTDSEPPLMNAEPLLLLGHYTYTLFAAHFGWSVVGHRLFPYKKKQPLSRLSLGPSIVLLIFHPTNQADSHSNWGGLNESWI